MTDGNHNIAGARVSRHGSHGAGEDPRMAVTDGPVSAGLEDDSRIVPVHNSPLSAALRKCKPKPCLFTGKPADFFFMMDFEGQLWYEIVKLNGPLIKSYKPVAAM
jgi:hypothetical protein